MLLVKRILHVSILLLAIFLFNSACNGDQKGSQSKTPVPPAPTGDSSLLTIAAIKDATDGKNITILFYERAAPYTIAKDDKAFVENKNMLNEAMKANVPIRVFAKKGATNITRFTKATEAEIRAYNTGEGINSPSMKIKSDSPIAVVVSKIDTSVFNTVEYQKWFPILWRCTNVVPNYSTLVAMFNHVAKEGCNNPGPYSITNCIPFQYVRDGCYARAHKMRQMLISKYGYCCEKVFSYGNLNVKANMWGGCCVDWWYHEVPLFRINRTFRGRTFQVCYVLDPGMFTTPVTLSTWLAAQENTSCNAIANVTSYSIQPGTAYWPSGGGYGTDPNYTLTEQTLINYKPLKTCN